MLAKLRHESQHEAKFYRIEDQDLQIIDPFKENLRENMYAEVRTTRINSFISSFILKSCLNSGRRLMNHVSWSANQRSRLLAI